MSIISIGSLLSLNYNYPKVLQLWMKGKLLKTKSESKWKKGKLWFADPEEQYILRLANTVTTMFHINTSLVKPGEIRRRWISDN